MTESLTRLTTRDGAEFTVRRASAGDLPAIVALLADDPLGQSRESATVDDAYRQAFDAVDADPGQLLLVIETPGAAPEVVGTCQLTFIPGISRHGMLRAQIEAVRIRADHSGQGLGTALFTWAISHARSRGCGLVQLTTDHSRADAHRFYDRLGFTASHTGYKLLLSADS